MNMQIKNKKPKKTHTNANKGKKKKTQKKMGSENEAHENYINRDRGKNLNFLR